jgi:hypothetical protein
MKKPAIAILVIATIAGAVLYWLSGNLDGLIKSALASHGSAMTKAPVSVVAVKIAPADGKGTISDLVIGNPAGFNSSHALKVGRIDVEVDLGSVAKDVILIRRIAVHGPDVIYEKGDAMTNFDAIQKNIAGYLGPADNNRSGKKLIVEELTIRDAKAHASAAFLNGRSVSVPLPDITLKNLGKAKGGITPGELGQEVAGALKAKLTGAIRFDRLLKSTGEVLESTGAKVKGLFK